MLEKLTLSNFKAWQRLEVDFGQVTGLFGTNSSGKSSLLQWLLLLKQTKNATDRGLVLDFGGVDKYVNLGTYQDMVHGHEPGLVLESQLAWKIPKGLRIHNPEGKRSDVLFSGNRMEAAFAISYRDQQLYADWLAYRFAGTEFALKPKSDSLTEYRLEPEHQETIGNFGFARTRGRPWALPGPVKNYLFPDQAKTFFKNADFLSDFELEYERLMDSIYYLGPLREHPKREYQWAGAKPQDVGIRGERTVDAILSATSRDERRNFGYRGRYRPFEEVVAYWLKELGLIHSFSVEEIAKGANLFRVRVKQDANSPEVLLTDVGFGVSQVLPALVLLYYVPEGSIILMEQPEIHLHPSVQSGLADVILQAAQHRNLQVIVESHSEHLLRRFQRRVAEDRYSADLLKLFFCKNERGKAQLMDLKLNLFGEIENWPEYFFGDEFGEVAATQEAGLERKLKEVEGG
jgi:predicted ATPase